MIEDDATGDVETSGVFDPASDGIDFYESIEAMRVQVNDPVAVGPTSTFGEIPVVVDGGTNASVRTARGGVIVRPTDFNPERVFLDDTLVSGGTPDVNVGDGFTTSAVGVLDYSFGKSKLNVTQPLTRVDNGLAHEVTSAPAAGELVVATFNVENLSPNDPQSKFDALANQIVNHLRSPDVITLKEIQDNNGATDNGGGRRERHAHRPRRRDRRCRRPNLRLAPDLEVIEEVRWALEEMSRQSPELSELALRRRGCGQS